MGRWVDEFRRCRRATYFLTTDDADFTDFFGFDNIFWGDRMGGKGKDRRFKVESRCLFPKCPDVKPGLRSFGTGGTKKG